MFFYISVYICLYYIFYISRPAGSNFIYPKEDEEPPPPVEKAKPPLGEEPEEDEPALVDSEAEDSEPYRESREDCRYISNMVARWAESDEEWDV